MQQVALVVAGQYGAAKARLVHPHLHKRHGGFAFGNLGHLVQHVHKWG